VSRSTPTEDHSKHTLKISHHLFLQLGRKWIHVYLGRGTSLWTQVNGKVTFRDEFLIGEARLCPAAKNFEGTFKPWVCGKMFSTERGKHLYGSVLHLAQRQLGQY
jgi:hypothetical protein